jgi:hypothetical protein
MNDAREPAVTRSSIGTPPDSISETGPDDQTPDHPGLGRQVDDRASRHDGPPVAAAHRPTQQPEGERLAEQGWGPTLRLTVLILARGLADRIAEKRSAPFGSVATRTAVSLAAAAAGAYAKVRGWW